MEGTVTRATAMLSYILRTLAFVLCVALSSPVWAAPTVTSFAPDEGSVAPVQTQVSATFSEPMDPATVTPGSFNVSRFVGIKSIDAAYNRNLVLKNDGTVVGWGEGIYGQNIAPAGLSGVKAIAAGKYHSVALKNDGTVMAWGTGYSELIQVPAGLSDVVAISAGPYQTVAVKRDGTIALWGISSYNMVPPGLSGVVAVDVGPNNTVVVKSDGTIFQWEQYYARSKAYPTGLSGVVAAAAGSSLTCALKNDGTVVCWDYSGNITATPAGLNNVVAISAGDNFALALKKDGTVVAWGANDYGQSTVPTGLCGVVAISAGNMHAVAVKSDGTVVTWGRNDARQAMLPPTLSGGIAAITGGYYTTTALKTDGTVVAWGKNNYAQTMIPAGLSGVTAIAPRGGAALKNDGSIVTWGTVPAVPSGQTGFNAVAVGSNATWGLKPDGTVSYWGSPNMYGYPVLSGVRALAVGSNHATVLKNDGTVASWGGNYYYQWPAPAGLSGVVAIAAGDNHTIALKSDGTVVGWGDAANWGKPADLSGVVAIAAAGKQSVALKGNGTVVAWGGGNTVPAGLSGVVAIGAGNYHVMALKADGTAVIWGNSNYFGETALPPSLKETPVSGNVTYDAPTNTATFTPLASLEEGGTYFATVNIGARNSAHIPFAADARSSFLTQLPGMANIALDGLIQPYDGAAKPVTVTTTPAGVPIVVTYDDSIMPPAEPGSYQVAANVVVPNYQSYQGSAFDILHITNASVSLEGLNHVFDGTPKTPTAITTPSGLAVQFTYNGSVDAPIQAGTYLVKATADGTGYHGYNADTMVIAMGTPVVTWGRPADITYGTTLGAGQLNATANVPGTFLYSPPLGITLNAGADQTLTVTFIPNDLVNYNTVTQTTAITVKKALATIAIQDLYQTYDGTPKAVSATTTPPNLAVDIRYGETATAPSGIGRYVITATVNDPNYEGSDSGKILSIAVKLTLQNLTQTYDGNAKSVMAVTDPPNIPYAVTYNVNDTVGPTNAGSYPVTATISDPLYDGTVTGTLVIERAAQVLQTIALNAVSSSGLPFSYALKAGSPAEIVGNTLVVTGAGTIEITASQQGDTNHLAAPAVIWTIVVP